MIYKDIDKIDFSKKKLFLFDIDRTLTLSKQPIDIEMCFLLSKLLEKREVALISGGKHQIFNEIYLKNVKFPLQLLSKFYLFPTCGACFYRHINGKQELVYFNEIPEDQRKKIISCFYKMFEEVVFQIPQNREYK